MDLSHLKHGDTATPRILKAGAVICLVAAGLVLASSLLASAHSEGTAMSTLHSVLSAITER